jgi:hypothetical protein
MILTPKPIYINEEKNSSFLYTTQELCDCCSNKLSKYAIYQESFSKSDRISNKFKIVCSDCRRKNKFEEQLFDFVNNRFVLICKKFPKGSIPYMPQQPMFKNAKNLSIFDVADKQISEEAVEDNTINSNRLQSDFDPALLEKRDNNLLEKDNYLNSSLNNNNNNLDNELKALSAPIETNLLEDENFKNGAKDGKK